MPSLRKTIIATRILLLAGASITTPAAAASFDGAWNVQIASTSSACGGGSSVSIGINNVIQFVRFNLPRRQFRLRLSV